MERKTLSGLTEKPDIPYFTWERLPTDNGYGVVKVQWLPNIHGKTGSHFFTKYRVKGESQWERTDPQLDQDYLEVHGLQPDTMYEFRVVSVDGDHITESQSLEVDTYGTGTLFL